MRNFENTNEETLKNGYRVMHVKWASTTWQTDIVNAATKRKGIEEGGDDESEIHTAMRRSLKRFTKTSDHYKPSLKITSVV
jgi:hypothetical protein